MKDYKMNDAWAIFLIIGAILLACGLVGLLGYINMNYYEESNDPSTTGYHDYTNNMYSLIFIVPSMGFMFGGCYARYVAIDDYNKNVRRINRVITSDDSEE